MPDTVKKMRINHFGHMAAKCAVLLGLFIYVTPASAQTVQQSGPVTQNHIATWATNGVIKDGGAVAANQSLMGGSSTTTVASTTVYCASSGCGVSTATASQVPFTGTLSNLSASVATAPGSGHSVVVTVYTGAYGSAAATSLTCTIANTATSCTDNVHQINLPLGTTWTIQFAVGASATSTGGQAGSVQLTSSAPATPTTPYVLQSGRITSGHQAVWTTNGVIQDGGVPVNSTIAPGPFVAGDIVFVNNLLQLADSGISINSVAPLYVASNTALKAFSITGLSSGYLIYRAGFSAPGDGGQAFYTLSASTCTLASGAGDNGMQVLPNAGTGCWIASPQAQWNILMWGAVCSTSTDSSTQVLNAIAALFAQTVPGGTLFFPCIITMNSALAIPFTGTNPPVQPFLELLGGTVPWGSALTGIVTPGGGGLNLLYTGGDSLHPAKIDTRGEGILKITNMVIEDTGTDNFLILQTTNTTLISKDNHYIGNPTCVAPACSQDILQFGGAGSGTGTTDANATFQGYNTSSINDKFSFCRHAANLNGNANAITFVNIAVDYTCGSAETFGAAFTLSGQAATADANVWLGGIIEMSHYPYAFGFFEASGIHNSSKNQIFGVYVGDPGGGTVAIAYVSANSCSNLIMPSLSASPLLAGPGVACNTGMSYDATNGWQVGTNVTVSLGLTTMGTQSTVGNGTGQGIFNMSGGSSGNGNGAGFFLKSGVTSKGGLGYYSAVLGGATPFNDNIMLFATDRILISGTGTTNCASGLATDAIGLTSCVASAARFKHDIADLSPSDAHRIAMRLTPRSFTYNGDAPLADAGQTAVGFIADEVAEVDPRLVGYDELGRPYVTRPDRILGVIDGTLHWQDGRIRALETQIMVIAFISISAILGFIILGCWWTRRSLGRTT